MKSKEITIKDFIGTAKFDEHGGGYIWGVDKTDGHQMIAEVRGWGAIQNLFKEQKDAAEFQDALGKFIAEAINDKLTASQSAGQGSEGVLYTKDQMKQSYGAGAIREFDNHFGVIPNRSPTFDEFIDSIIPVSPSKPTDIDKVKSAIGFLLSCNYPEMIAMEHNRNKEVLAEICKLIDTLSTPPQLREGEFGNTITMTISCKDKEQYDRIMNEVRTLAKESKLTCKIT